MSRLDGATPAPNAGSQQSARSTTLWSYIGGVRKYSLLPIGFRQRKGAEARVSGPLIARFCLCQCDDGGAT